MATPNPWNIVRTYNLTPGRELLFACRYRNFVVYMSEADNVYDPLYGSFVGDQGAWSTAKMYFTVPPNGVAKLHFGAHFQAPGLPNRTVDVYGLQILDATLKKSKDTAASALLLRHEFLDGQLHGGRLPAERLRHDPERLRLNIVRDAGETLLLRLPVQAGHGLQLGDVRQRGRQRLCGRHRHLPLHALAGCLEHGAPRLLGAAGRRLKAALRSLRRLDLVQQSAGTLDLYSMQIRASAFEGESVSVTDLLTDLLALTGSATLDGLTAQGNVGCNQLLCNDVNCTDVFTTGVDASGAVSCAALTATGTVAGASCRPQGPSSLSISGAASLLSSATGITGSTLTINNTANAGTLSLEGVPKWFIFYLRGSQHSSVQHLTSSCEGFEV